MPFIVVATYSPRLLFKPVVITEVDPFLLVSCQNIITLIAVVEGDLAGHSYYWEQTGGPTVTWLEPQNQLEVMFQKNTSGDLFFRFWMDKDTPYEQYRDTLVAGVARDDVPFSTDIVNSAGISDYNYATTGITLPTLVPGLTKNTVTYNNSVKTLFWTNPTPTYPLVNTKNELFVVNGSTLTSLGVFQSPLNSYANLSINQPNLTSQYVIRTYYDLYSAGQFSTFYDTNFNFNSNVYLDTGEDVTSEINGQVPGSISTYQLQLLELTSVTNSEVTSVDTIATSIGAVSTYQLQLLSLIGLTDNLVDTTSVEINSMMPGTTTVYQIQTSSGITVI